MTQEERTLLHIDLSQRVPYDIVLRVKGLVTSNEEFGDAYLDTVSWYEEVSVRDGSRVSYDITDVRPYLRPMSSMTEDEYNELKKISSYYGLAPFEDIHNWEPNYNLIDWLNRKMFDYRDLIPLGLGLEAPEGMYNN